MTKRNTRRLPNFTHLTILSDLLRGGRHSRQTIARQGVSLPTADRWIKQLLEVPGIRKVREGNVTWIEAERRTP